MPKYGRREAVEGYLSILPWLIGFSLFIGGPLIASVVLSFARWDIINPARFVGLDNYKRLFFGDPYIWQSLKVTAVYSAIVIPIGMLLGFAIALLMNQKLLGVSVWRTLYYMPVLVSGAALAVVWQILLNPEFGYINQGLRMLGFVGPRWLYSTEWALPGLMIMGLWQSGGAMIIYLAGLQGIPTQLYEAAEIDGASIWHKFFRITIPMMTPILFFQLVMGIIGTLQYFTGAYIMTRGGPEKATLFYGLQLYFRAFSDFEMGYACAMAWFLFVIILALTYAIFRTSGGWVYYGGQRGK